MCSPLGGTLGTVMVRLLHHCADSARSPGPLSEGSRGTRQLWNRRRTEEPHGVARPWRHPTGWEWFCNGSRCGMHGLVRRWSTPGHAGICARSYVQDRRVGGRRTWWLRVPVGHSFTLRCAAVSVRAGERELPMKKPVPCIAAGYAQTCRGAWGYARVVKLRPASAGPADARRRGSVSAPDSAGDPCGRPRTARRPAAISADGSARCCRAAR